MSFNFGERLKVQIFGQSHSEMIGCVIDGLPAGLPIDDKAIAAFMSRRAPGKNKQSTARKETDAPYIMSGLVDGHTCGAPLAAAIENSDQHSKDYEKLRYTPRPNHADYASYVKYGGNADIRGGGFFSGRMTAPLCFAGAVAMQWLDMLGVNVGAHIYQLGDVRDRPFDPLKVNKFDLSVVPEKEFPVLDSEAGEKMKAKIDAAREVGDSVGGSVECAVIGVPIGIGDPRYDGIQSTISRIVFGIPAVKGIEFGLGFGFASAKGSEVNDAMSANDDGDVVFASNNCGGISGGIADGRPIIFRCAFKPTPSIGMTQKTVDLSTGETVDLDIGGRHDPCVVHRAVPVVEAAAALAIADMILMG